LGRNLDGVNIPGTLNVSGNGIIGGNLGVGTSAPSARLQVNTAALDQHVYLSSAAPSLALGNSDARSAATMNSIFALSTVDDHFGVEAGGLTIANHGNERGNIYINSNYSGDGVTRVILQPTGGNVVIGAPISLSYRLAVDSSGRFDGGLSIGNFGSAGGGAPTVCRDNSFGWLGFCSSSLRYKTNVTSFESGLEIVDRLRPISFTWKNDRSRDIGLAAEEVERVEPLLTFRNDKGEIEGVKYDQLSAVFINAFKQQQRQIQTQSELLKKQQSQIEALKKLICADNPTAELCKPN